MFRQECLRKVNQVGNNLIIRIRPIGCKFKRVTCLFSRTLPTGYLFYSADSRRITVILGMSPIADDKDLHILIQSGRCPERVTLIAVDLIERFPDCYTPSL